MRFPFARLLALAVTHLRIGPDAAWNMTPRELHDLLMQVCPPAAAPDRDDLRALMRRYPDQRRPEPDA